MCLLRPFVANLSGQAPEESVATRLQRTARALASATHVQTRQRLQLAPCSRAHAALAPSVPLHRHLPQHRQPHLWAFSLVYR